MFSITQVGNRVDISSSGIDFRITGSLVSGTSYMIANIEAIGYDWDITSVSGTLVNVKLIVSGDTCELRNNWNYIDGLEMKIPAKDASGIAGDADLVHFSTDLYSTGAVRNGDYVYIIYSSYSAGLCQVIEYQISTGDTNTIEIFNDPSASAYDAAISFIDERKVLVWSDNDTSPSNIYIADFDDLSLTVTTTMTSPKWLRAAKKADGNIWLFVIGGYSDYDLEIQRLNYTAGGSWSSVNIAIDWITWDLGNDPIFAGEDYNYIVVPYIDGGTDGVAVVYNTILETITISSSIVLPVGGYTNWVSGSAWDTSNNLAYISMHGYDITSFDPLTYNTWEAWFSLDPVSATMTQIYIRSDVGVANEFRSYPFTSREHVYFMQFPITNLYQASTLAYQGVFAATEPTYNFCHQIDGAGPSIWWWYDATKTLYRLGLDGGAIASFNPPIIENYSCYDMQILHAKDCLIMLLHEQQPLTFNHFYRWYLIT
jgi:hypothetical protein